MAPLASHSWHSLSPAEPWEPVTELAKTGHQLTLFSECRCGNSALPTRKCQPKCLMGLSSAQDRAASESQRPRLRFHRCTRVSCALAVMSKSALPWVVGSSPCERLLRGSIHTDVCEDNIACTIFVVGALAARSSKMMFVECFYMVGILTVCQALAFRAAARWSCGVWQATATHHSPPGASILVGLGGLEKAFLAKDSDGTELIPVVRAIGAGLFDFFPDELSAEVLHGLVRGPSSRSNRVSQGPRVRLHRCTRGSCSLAVTSKSARPRAVGSSPCWCVSTSEFPRRRLQCLHTAGALAKELQEVVLLCLATNSPWVWRTTLKMTMGMLPGLNSLVQVVREGDFAHTCIHSTVAICFQV